MKARSILIAGFLLSPLFVLCIVPTEPFGQCDPPVLSIQGVNIQCAHMVSSGAYFRFWIFNNLTYPINVTINGVDTLSIPYDVIAPQISAPYQKVTYTFVFSVDDGYFWKPVDYTVLVLNSSFVQIFDLIVPILIVIAFVIIVTVAIVILRRYMHRRRSNSARAWWQQWQRPSTI